MISSGSFLDHCCVDVSGNNNTIELGRNVKMVHCSIKVSGNCNHILIGENGTFYHTEIHIEDDNNRVEIGPDAQFCGNTHLAAIEGTQIHVGRDCLFSSEIHITTGDSHSILDLSKGIRVNPSRAIYIGDHVWIGKRAILLKGSHIADHSVVGAGSVVTSQHRESSCALAGNPARVIKTGVDWEYKRLPMQSGLS